ncbi:SigB/SigF/SigG family RNA polymerase sigma factor [Speluncibacter jeojiensis]|uniref:SigB/SigF/SigG family RNA polymerase sigma factor n=1 Tax=Speluncibacter jeojiensis TaxID=2710754 RepID=A0A9X4LYZ3_9ACTN|nr:SigB/SigF/SigG family RNA polymerase sigma factor [Corynebacteriales bacterium D3-21]
MRGESRGRGRSPTASDDYADVLASFEKLAACESPEKRRTLRDGIVERCLPLAAHIARRFQGRGEPYDDLLQVASLGLVNAVNRFDVDRGADFVSFAVPTIMGEVRRHFRDAGWAMRVPRRMKEMHLQISAAVSTLSQRLGRAPTAKEIAAELGVDVAEVSEGLLAGSAYQTISADAAIGDRNDDMPMLETLGEEDRELEKVEYYAAVRPILEKLPERERRILTLRFFRSMTQTQIAEQMGISQMHVSRILARTLARVRSELDAQGHEAP